MLSYTDTANVLRQLPLFRELPDDGLVKLAHLSREQLLEAKNILYWEDDPSDFFYVIAEGRVRVFKHASGGKEVTIGFFSAGEMFGEVAIFDGGPYPASVQATTTTRLLGIKKTDFLSFIDAYPQVAVKIITVLGSRLRESLGRLRDLAGEKMEQRLARMLLMLAAKLGDTLPFTRQEIADMAGTTTETAIRVMGQFKERGIISSQRGKITIIDKSKLYLLSLGPPRI